MTQIIVEKDAKDFRLDVIHMNNKGKVLETRRVETYNSRDTFVSHEEEPVYLCILANTTKPLVVEIIPNLMLPDQESFPTKGDADRLQRELFVTNSKLLELIGQQIEFKRNEEEGMQANMRVEDGLKWTLYLELVLIVIICAVQYLFFRNFSKRYR